MPRTSFNSSRLIRSLADLASADVAESKQSFAERLSHWLDLTDSLALFSALKSGAADTSGSPSPAPAAGHPMQEALARVRATLMDSITTDGVLNPGKARIRLPAPAPGVPLEEAADFTPYHRYYLAHQRDMNANIGQLRATVREALASYSPTHKRLAALDAVLDQALSARERNLFSTVPLFLARRFEHLRKAHREALAATAAADDPGLWLQPGGWLAAFCRDMQGVLLAELDLRLQPVTGLIEALSNKVTEHQ